MAQWRPGLIALMLLVCAGLAACGTRGRTSSFVLPLDLPKEQTASANLRIASAAMGANAAHLIAVNVQSWGKFGANDLRNLERSLRDTMAPYLLVTSGVTESRLDIHLVIRRYVVGVSNTGGAVLACVAWAATADRTPIYEEQFYASDAGYLIGTIGGVKDAVHEAIVRRIAMIALALAADPSGARPRPTTFDKTSTSLDEAVSRLPKTMVPMGNPSMMASPFPVVTVLGALSPSGISTVQWSVANPSERFDWHGYLERLYPIP